MSSEISLTRSLLAVLSAELTRLEARPMPDCQEDRVYLATALEAAEHSLREALSAAAVSGLDLDRIAEALRRCAEQRWRLEAALELGAIEPTRKTQITRLIELGDAEA